MLCSMTPCMLYLRGIMSLGRLCYFIIKPNTHVSVRFPGKYWMVPQSLEVYEKQTDVWFCFHLAKLLALFTLGLLPTNHIARDDQLYISQCSELTVQSQYCLNLKKLNSTEVTRVFDLIKLNSISWMNQKPCNRFSTLERQQAQSGRWRWGRGGGGGEWER